MADCTHHFDTGWEGAAPVTMIWGPWDVERIDRDDTGIMGAFDERCLIIGEMRT
jgi:hypothetical protein